MHLVHGEFSAGGSGIRICLSACIYGRTCADETLCGAAFGIRGTLRLLIELGKGDLEELLHLLRVTFFAGEDMC